MINLKPIVEGTDSVISQYSDLMHFSNSLRISEHQKISSQKIFVWSGFGNAISNNLFEKDTWLQNFVGLFSNQEMWPWKFKFAGDEFDQLGNQDLIEALGPNARNMIASLRIRAFDSTDQFQGSVDWFDEVVPYLKNEYNESMELINHVIESLRATREMGINLLLEKISIIINSDPNNSITLTPHLHRDGAYGHMESSIVSFYSEQITPHSSTLFFPDFDFEAASHLKPVTAEKITNQFPNTTAYSVNSGSLAIFSGKLARDGSKDDTRGALHISPEGFFPTRRLMLLFRSNISY